MTLIYEIDKEAPIRVEVPKELFAIHNIPKSPLNEATMWNMRQIEIEKNLDRFAAHDMYLDQGLGDEFYRTQSARFESRYNHNDAIRDVAHGAKFVSTPIGPVTRQWIDSQIELDFLRRHLPVVPKAMIDVGAGYGRFAVEFEKEYPECEVTCVDAIPVSTFLCAGYTQTYGKRIRTIAPKDLDKLGFDLAVNIHSWNECSFEQVARWIDALIKCGVKYLFVVSNDDTWYTMDKDFGPSFRPLLAAKFDLLAEEILSNAAPHTLWKLKNV